MCGDPRQTEGNDGASREEEAARTVADRTERSAECAKSG